MVVVKVIIFDDALTSSPFSFLLVYSSHRRLHFVEVLYILKCLFIVLMFVGRCGSVCSVFYTLDENM